MNDIYNTISNFAKKNLSSVNDVDFDKAASMFVNNGGYDEKISLEENLKIFYKTIALGKANNII